MSDTGPWELQYRLMADWPALAWLAVCSAPARVIEVLHGRWVETQPQWFCEAVWADHYAPGDFDRTDLVFGSGGRVRDRGPTFVSSSSTVDRLHSCQGKDSFWVSNSLVCLLAARDAKPDPGYTRYDRDFKSICHGVEGYTRTLPTSVGPLTLTYYRNLVWNSTQLIERDKAAPVRDFTSFARYREFLVSSLRRLAENLAAPERQHPYQMLGTLSSGYDSAAVVAIARQCGLREVISF